jgi:hypothetical protein
VSNFYADPGQLAQSAEVFSGISADAAGIPPTVAHPLENMKGAWGNDEYGAGFAEQVLKGVGDAGKILAGGDLFFRGVQENIVATADLIAKANDVNTTGATHLAR